MYIFTIIMKMMKMQIFHRLFSPPIARYCSNYDLPLTIKDLNLLNLMLQLLSTQYDVQVPLQVQEFLVLRLLAEHLLKSKANRYNNYYTYFREGRIRISPEIVVTVD